jgi:hypothetical protein
MGNFIDRLSRTASHRATTERHRRIVPEILEDRCVPSQTAATAAMSGARPAFHHAGGAAWGGAGNGARSLGPARCRE